jgi:hypothetical protein
MRTTRRKPRAPRGELSAGKPNGNPQHCNILGAQEQGAGPPPSPAVNKPCAWSLFDSTCLCITDYWLSGRLYCIVQSGAAEWLCPAFVSKAELACLERHCEQWRRETRVQQKIRMQLLIDWSVM